MNPTDDLDRLFIELNEINKQLSENARQQCGRELTRSLNTWIDAKLARRVILLFELERRGIRVRLEQIAFIVM